jgi:hypothetical protein
MTNAEIAAGLRRQSALHFSSRGTDEWPHNRRSGLALAGKQRKSRAIRRFWSRVWRERLTEVQLWA